MLLHHFLLRLKTLQFFVLYYRSSGIRKIKRIESITGQTHRIESPSFHPTMATATQTKSDPSTARKRRKEILTTTRQNVNKRSKPNDPDKDNKDVTTCSEKSKTKYQNRYEPEVPMTKEEAAEWRREARRKRNRESAAASRNKVRNRIAELEEEVEEWKNKYQSLFERIGALENIAKMSSTVRPDVRKASVSPCTSPVPISRPVVDLQDLSRAVQASSSDTANDPDLTIDAMSVPLNLSLPSFDSQSSPSTHSPIIQDDSHNVSVLGSPVVSAKASSSPTEFHVIEMTSRPA